MVQTRPLLNQAQDTAWHAIPAESALSNLESTIDGLSSAEAKRRLEIHGPNRLDESSGPGILQLIWGQINNPLIWVLLASSVIAMLADPKDGIKNGLVILAVIVINTIIGLVQELKATKAIAALSKMVPQNAQAIRDGEIVDLPVDQLVPGDVVRLISGDKVPADLRLIQLKTLQIEEAALTGESVPSEKSLDLIPVDAALGDRKNLAFSGSLVTYGTGLGLVVKTGNATELGQINTMLSQAEHVQTPLSIALEKIGKILTIGIAIVAVLMIFVGAAREMSQGTPLADAVRESLIFAITLAVGAIPEGLPAIVTIALAIGVQRMAQRKAVVRTLPSVETLGSTTVICSDKTGTLTRNEMTVKALWTPSEGLTAVEGVGYEPTGAFSTPLTPAQTQLLRLGTLCNDSALLQDDGRWIIQGDPTEGALIVAAEKAGMAQNAVKSEFPRLDTLPFESENQFMGTLHVTPEGRKLIIKGAPEVVLSRCANAPEGALDQVRALAQQGMRVLAFAEKKFDQDTFDISHTGGEFEFAGLQGMIDPPRVEVMEAIKVCHTAGITVKMITGDHPETAKAIGVELGIAKTDDTVVTGKLLAETDDEALKALVKTTNVFARVAPEHKYRIVRALQANGEIAAMTGDGVNDAPALKQSNIGVAMGITGTSVSKEAADIVLTDDNFTSIAAAVEEGRRVYDNLIKSLAFVLPTNLGLALILCCAVAAFPMKNGELLLPMSPVQILWINLVGAVALALPLAFEAKEPNLMNRPPRNSAEPILNRFVVMRTIMAAVLMTVGAVGVFLWEYWRELPRVEAGLITEAVRLAEAQTMAVTAVIAFQIFYMLNCRSLKDSILKIGLFSNKAVFWGIGVLLLLQAAFIYTPAMQTVFGTASLDGFALAMSALAAFIIVPVVSIEKMISSRKSS